MHPSTRRSSIALAAVLMSSAASVVSAAPGVPLWARPADSAAATALRSTYQVFDNFSDDDSDPSNGIQDLSPDFANINPNGSASVSETSGQSFLTGTGNIYSFSAIVDMTVTVPNYVGTTYERTAFLFQLETLGSELVRVDETPTYDFSAFTINGTALTSFPSFEYKELSRLPGNGAQVEHSFAFIVPSTAASHAIAYKPLETSNSQARIGVDSFVLLAGDFDYDGDRDSHDIDLLLRATAGAASPANALFDINSDGNIVRTRDAAASDADLWVHGLEQTEYGDTNLDGAVNFADLLTLAQNYGSTAGLWATGDFNGSDTVDFADLLTLAQNYGFGAASVDLSGFSPSFAADWQLAVSLTPEPVSVGSLAILAGIVRRRRVAR